MRTDTPRAISCSLSAAVAVLMFVVGCSAALADSHNQGGRSSMSSSRQVGSNAGRMGRAARGARMRDGRHTVRNDRGGRWRGWFNRGGRREQRTFIGFGRGSSRGGYRSSGSFFFGYSFTASEYRRSSGRSYRRDTRSDYRSANSQRAQIKHVDGPSGRMYVPLVANPAAPEVLPAKD